jgi:hypothetical protein
MTTVYLATAGEYSDYRVRHAFARREDAEAYPLGDDVLELEVHDGPVDVRRWHTLNWRAGLPEQQGNPTTWAQMRDFDASAGRAEHRWFTVMGVENLNVEGWDLALVKKVYSEQRAQYLARQEGIT